MASFAIDQTEIRPSRPAETVPARPTRSLSFAALTGAVALVSAGAWAFHDYLPSVPRLGGLSSIVEPPRPARTDIRIGSFPAMPEIRDGVPALVEPRAVRVVGTSPAAMARPVEPGPLDGAGAPPARRIAVPATRGASLLSPTLSAPAALASVEPVRRMEGPGAMGIVPVRSGETARPALPPPAIAEVGSGSDPAQAAPGRRPPADISAAEPALLRSEPAETATVSRIAEPAAATMPASPQASSVPLPPPAPPRSARAAEPDRPPPVRLAARPKPRQTADAAPAAVAPAPPDPAPDDRLEVLGMKLPNGRDIGNALSALGDTVKNLPQRF